MDAKVLLGHVSGGKVLDVATGNGNFIQILMDGLTNCDNITGIDTKDGLEVVFDANFKNQSVHYKKMDAATLQIADATFDTVCISNSLHHMPELDRTLKEMLRVLKPGGHFIISEMYRDNQSAAQMSHVYLHHWWAAIDQTQGIFHGETFSRAEILELVANLGLVEMRMYDLYEANENPHSPEILAELEPVIERYIQRADRYPELQKRGEELRQRVNETGFDGATTLFLIGRKDDNLT